MAEVRESATLQAPRARVWEVLTDYGNIATWFADAEHSALLTPPPIDVGAERRIQIDRMTLVERIVDLEPLSRLAYEIEGLPPVVRGARSEWTLVDAPNETTRVTLRMAAAMAAGPLGAVLFRAVLRRVLSKQVHSLIEGLRAACEGARTGPG